MTIIQVLKQTQPTLRSDTMTTILFRTSDNINDAYRFETLEAAQKAAGKLAQDEYAQESGYRFRVFDVAYTREDDGHSEERTAFVVAATYTGWDGHERTEVVK
jgi:hypothetical protein